MANRKKAETPKQLRIKQIRSLSGRPELHRKTMKALGLKHHQMTVVHADNPAIRGMLFQVRHLVQVDEVEA